MRTASIFVLMLILSCQATYAQTVSIINFTDDNDSVQVEAAMKRYLGAEGYTVKSNTNEGIVLVLAVMRSETKTGAFRGVLVGHVTVLTVNWQEFADLGISEPCKADHALAQKVKDYLGTRVIWLTSQMATGPDAEGLAEMLVTGNVNNTIRETVRKMRVFLDEVGKVTDEQSKDVIIPYR